MKIQIVEHIKSFLMYVYNKNIIKKIFLNFFIDHILILKKKINTITIKQHHLLIIIKKRRRNNYVINDDK